MSDVYAGFASLFKEWNNVLKIGIIVREVVKTLNYYIETVSIGDGILIYSD